MANSSRSRGHPSYHDAVSVTESEQVWVETPDLGVTCRAAAEQIELPVTVEVLPPTTTARQLPEAGHNPARLAMVWLTPPPVATVAGLAQAARRRGCKVVVGLLADPVKLDTLPELAADLGLIVLTEIESLLAALALLRAGLPRPWALSSKALPPAAQAQLAPLTSNEERRHGALTMLDPLVLAVQAPDNSEQAATPARVGTVQALSQAIAAMRVASDIPPPATAAMEPQPDARDILYGPARALSDPASKRVLELFGVPIPSERLCASPSRAAAEAQRLGWPVRVSLASPDLRLWDHPELCRDGLTSASDVKEAFRELQSHAQALDTKARVLGSTVAATAPTQAILRAEIRPLETVGHSEPDATRRAVVRLGFADPHGLASGDHTDTLLPTTGPGLERVLARLAGSPLLLGGGMAQRRVVVEGLRDLLMRCLGLLNAHPELQLLLVEPLALLPGGRWEVRDASLEVGDAFQQALDRPA